MIRMILLLVCGGWSRVWWWVCLLLLPGGCVMRLVCVWRRLVWCVVSRLLDCLVPLVLIGGFVPEGWFAPYQSSGCPSFVQSSPHACCSERTRIIAALSDATRFFCIDALGRCQ